VDGLAVHAALLEIEPAQRQVIQLIDLDGMSVQEASRVLGVPVGTVKSRAARGRESLKIVLSKILSINGNQSVLSNVIPLEVKHGKKR